MLIRFSLHEDVTKWPFWRAIISEFLGTFFLVLLGCGTVCVSGPDVPNNSADMTRIGLAFGLTVLCLVWTLGPESGCHLNPSISFGFFCIGRISLLRAVIYTAAQCVGAIAAAGVLYGIVPADRRGTLGATGLGNGLNAGQGFGMEFAMTFMFLMTICACVDEGRLDRSKNLSAIPLTIGFCLGFLVMLGIPYTGTSVNPARSFGPALISGYWDSHWIYWVGPLSGGCVGSLVYRFVFSSALHADIRPARSPAAAAIDPNYAQSGQQSQHSAVQQVRSNAPMVMMSGTMTSATPRDLEEGGEITIVNKPKHAPLRTQKSNAPMVTMTEPDPEIEKY